MALTTYHVTVEHRSIDGADLVQDTVEVEAHDQRDAFDKAVKQVRVNLLTEAAEVGFWAVRYVTQRELEASLRDIAAARDEG